MRHQCHAAWTARARRLSRQYVEQLGKAWQRRLIGALVLASAAIAAPSASVQAAGLPKQEPPPAIVNNLATLVAAAQAAGTAGVDYWTWAEQSGVWTESTGYPAYDPAINDPRVPPAKYLGPGGVYHPFVQMERAYHRGSGTWPGVDYTPAQERYVRGE